VDGDATKKAPLALLHYMSFGPKLFWKRLLKRKKVTVKERATSCWSLQYHGIGLRNEALTVTPAAPSRETAGVARKEAGQW